MKKTIKIKSLTIALMLVLSFMPNGYAVGYKKILAAVEQDFDSTEDKFSVITKRMSQRSAQYDNPNSQYLYADDEHTFHALACAIMDGDLPLVEKFLTVVENPDDSSLLIRSREKSYNLVTLVCDLTGFHDKRTLENRLKTLDLLAAKKFNFNYIDENNTECVTPLIRTIISTNGPPLSAHKSEVEQMRMELGARLLLQGADAQAFIAKGPDDEPVRFLEDLINHLVTLANTQLDTEEGLRDKINPTPYIRDLLQKKKEEPLVKELSDLSI